MQPRLLFSLNTTASSEVALATALNTAVVRMEARLAIMEDSVSEMIERADQLAQLASSLEGARLFSPSIHILRTLDIFTNLFPFTF